MPKVNRNNISYEPLPSEVTVPSIPDAKCAVSFNITVPKGMEKHTSDFIADIQDDITKKFQKFIKKEIERIIRKKMKRERMEEKNF